jgi:hypothetical protein
VGKRVNGVLERAWLYADGLSPIAEYDGAGQLATMFIYADPVVCVDPEPAEPAWGTDTATIYGHLTLALRRKG